MVWQVKIDFYDEESLNVFIKLFEMFQNLHSGMASYFEVESFEA